MKKQLLSAVCILSMLLSGCTLTERLTSQLETNDTSTDSSVEANTNDGFFGMAYFEGEKVNPVLSSSKVNRLLCEALYEGLFQLNDSFQPQPVLCQTYTGDGIHYTFTLKNGITFWSGEPVRASDVIYSYQTALTSETSPYKNRLAQIKSMRATGDLTLEIELQAANSLFPTLLDIPIFRQGTENNDFSEGCGPYQPQSDGSQHWLVASQSWHGGYATNFTTISLTGITSSDAAEYSFQTGDISIARADRISATPTTFKGAVEIHQVPTTDFHFLGFNAGHAPYHLSQVRRAISLAINRNRLCTTQLQNFADPAVLPVNPQPPHSDTLSYSMESDNEAALALLAQSGITDTNGDGILEYTDASGKRMPMTPTIVVNQENTFKTAVVTQIISDLEQIGIRATMKAVSFDDYQSALVRSEYDLFYGETLMTPDFDPRPLVAIGGTLNYGACGNTELNNLMNQVYLSTGEAKATAMENLYTRFLQDMPILPLAFTRSQVVLRGNTVKNFQCLPYNVFYNINDWMK